MYRFFLVLLIPLLYVVGCSPKLTSTASDTDYSEDVSAFRPKVEITDENADQPADAVEEKGPYVAPTHDINGEMSVIMDSIIVNNKNKQYLTYTIQVYIGRSREEANQVREKVYRLLPEEKPILSYKQPSYKVNVGKYIDRVEAYKMLTTIRGIYPGAIMVPERNYME